MQSVANEEELIRLLKFGTMKKIRELVNSNPTMDLHYPTKNLSTPLTTAIERSDPMIVSFLIDKLPPSSLDSTLTQACGKTALMHAAYCTKNPEVLSVLMRKGADVNKTDINGWNSLFYAVIGKRIKNVAALLDLKLSIESTDNEGRTPLMISIYLSNNEIFNYLLSRNANLNAIDNYGLTALHLAIIRRRRDCVIELLTSNLDVIDRPTPFTGISSERLREEIMIDVLPAKRKVCEDCEDDSD